MWGITLLVIIIVVVWRTLQKQAAHPLARLPGPRKLPLIGSIWHFIGLSNRELFTEITSFRKKYGDRGVIQVFNRFVLHISNEDDIEVVLSHSRNIRKNTPYKFLMPWLGSGLLISSGSKWHSRRKILTPSFHFNILKHFSTVMEKKSQTMVEQLTEKIKKGDDVLDVIRFISDCTLYIICETAMGTKLDSDKSDATLEYKKEIQSIGGIIMQRLTRHWLHSDFIFKMTPLGKRFAKSLVTVQTFADDVISKRKAQRQKDNFEPLAEEDESLGTKRRLAFLDLLLEAESKGEIDLEGIRDEVNTFMFEGHDTTAMALTFGLMLLAEHEHVQERIFEECQSIFGASQRTPNLQDQAEMKYLEAVIKEILRLYPSVPFIGREITEDFVLGDLEVPKGSDVLVHIYDVHRHEDIYPDPDSFKPERFLSSEPKHPYAFVPFSAGPRNCIGRRFAMQEMKCMLSQLVRNFRLAPVTGRPALVADLVLRPSEPILVKFIPRS